MHIATIESIIPVTPTVRIFRLSCTDSSFYRLAGQWINVGREINGAVPVASYSIASSPNNPGDIELAVRYSDQHPLTKWLHESAQPGDLLSISSGKGGFVWHPGMTERVVLIGAGTGITPLMSIYRLAATVSKPRPATLLYSVSNLSEYLYRDEIHKLAQTGNVAYITTLTQPDADWDGRTGRINLAMLQETGLDNDTLYYLCGPRDMVDDLNDALRNSDVPIKNIMFEKWW